MGRNKHANKKKKWMIRISAAVIAVGIYIGGQWLWNHYAVWSYFDRGLSTPMVTRLSSPTPRPTSTQTPIPTPEITTESTQPATPTPTPTPVPHPGDRDGKFTKGEVIITDTTYQDADISVEIEQVQRDDITYYVAEVYVRSMDQLSAAFADADHLGRVAATSEIVNGQDAIFGVNGDYFNQQSWGVVIRNGELYKDQPRRDIMVFYDNGMMETYHPDEITTQQLLDDGARHVYSFGPLLMENGYPIPDFSNISALWIRHPRCGIGYIEPYHYIFIVVDGRRQGYSIGMTLDEFAAEFYKYGCTSAYNLDGGGTATMIFMGELVNRPQGFTRERHISDAVVVGPGRMDQSAQGDVNDDS